MTIAEERIFLANAALERLAPAITSLRLRERLRRESVQDPLTGLFNRRHMESALERQLTQATRTGDSVGVIMLDIDHFKRVNDEHGHAAGDAVLSELGRTLRERFRGEDIACRYGGEEFALILGGAHVMDLVSRGEELREHVRDLRIVHRELELRVTVSLGLALFPSHAGTSDELLRAADHALYQAKASGRDRAVVFRKA